MSETSLTYHQKRYQERKAKGLCCDCGKKATRGGKCKEHHLRQLVRQREKYHDKHPGAKRYNSMSYYLGV